MSRSFKKPYVKYGMPGGKTIGARRERHLIKQLLKPWRYCYTDCQVSECFISCAMMDNVEHEICPQLCWALLQPLEPELPLRKQIMDSYTVCDWRIYRPDNPKYYRK